LKTGGSTYDRPAIELDWIISPSDEPPRGHLFGARRLIFRLGVIAGPGSRHGSVFRFGAIFL